MSRARSHRWAAAAILLVASASCQAPAPEPTAAQLGLVRGVVIDALTGRPVAGVVVGAKEARSSARTDRSGRFELPLAVGAHRLTMRRGGYLDSEHAFVQVSAGEVTPVEPRVFRAAPSDEVIDAYFARQPVRRHAHPAHERPGAPAELDDGDIGAVRAGIHEPPVLPETIRVWRSGGTPLQPTSSNGWADNSCHPDAVVIELPLEEYVKGVIPHEWIPSWHPEALRAGAIAARTYASNWSIRGGRWDCADVDDGTVTQVYRDDRADATNQAVDDTAGEVVVRDHAVISSEYSAENSDPTEFGVAEPTCTGTDRFGHGRGMCQWGTHRWASGTCANEPCDFGALGGDPKDRVWMVEHYYPGATVAGADVTPPAPCRVLGADGGVLDDAGPCFAAYGPAEYWRTATDAGWDGSLRWTNAYEAASPSNWAQWRIHIESPGDYRVEVYVDAAYGVYPETRYGVSAAGGDSEVIVNQSAADGWVELGTFRFDGEGAVSVYDNYAGSIPADQHIAADAIRLTPVTATPSSDAGSSSPGPDAGTTPPGAARLLGPLPDEVRPDGGCAATASSPAPWSAPPLLLALAALALIRRRR